MKACRSEKLTAPTDIYFPVFVPHFNLLNMYHNAYSSSWIIGNQIPKSPVLLTYGDLPLLTVDHLAAFMPLAQQQPIYTSQVAFDMPNMKRIPISLLMQGVDSVSCYVPIVQRQGVGQPVLKRQLSKESLHESACSGDSGLASSPSPMPSSGNASYVEEIKNLVPVTSVDNVFSSSKQPRRNFHHNFSPGKNQQRRFSYNPRFSPVVQKSTSTNLPNGHSSQALKDEWHVISQGIWVHYERKRQREAMYCKKMNLRTVVHQLLNQIFPNCCLSVVGSTVNGLGTNASDVDMCLILSTMEIDQQTEAMQLLRHAQRLLSQSSFVKSTELITAKVPILKFTDKYDIQVDLNINNTVGIANTQLLKAYSSLDWRVPPLVLIIKRWAQVYDINNAKEMTLSSYSLVLMIIHFLQCGCFPIVLPCLQKMRPRRVFPGDCYKWPIPYADGFNFSSRNSESLGKLLYRFFDYFTNKFDFEKDVMSVRLGCKLPKQVAMNYRSTKNKRGHWKFVCIEEPFNRTNTACAVYDQDSYNRIYSAFRSTWQQLKNRKDVSVVLGS